MVTAMPSTYEPLRRTFGDLFGSTDKTLVVPIFQRNYSWTFNEAEEFWKDLDRFQKKLPGSRLIGEEYFLGSVVLVDEGNRYLVLDGQQRLATGAMLISVIRDNLRTYKQDAATRLADKFLRSYDDATETLIDKLTLNKYDKEFFRREVLESRDEKYVVPEPKLESHRKIRRVREFFVSKLKAQFESLGPREAYSAALRIQQVVTSNLSVIAVVTKDRRSAEIAFETLNDRGIGLSSLDLLRSFLLSRGGPGNEEEIANGWGELLDLETDVLDVRAFLRYFWVSHYGDVKAHSLYREISQKIEDEQLDAVAFTRSLTQSAATFRAVAIPDTGDDEYDDLLKKVALVGAGVLYPLILAATEVFEDRTARLQVARAALHTFARHNIIAQKENSMLESEIFVLAPKLRSGEFDVAQVVARLSKFAPNDEEFEKAFATVSITRGTVRAYILRELESDLMKSEELKAGPPKKVNVDHIYPQKPPEERKWKDHDDWVNRLGNLTLLSAGKNKGSKNDDFEKKRPVYAASRLKLNEAPAAEESWGPEQITRRQAALARRAVQIWSFA